MGRLAGDSLAAAQPCATWPGIADPAFGWTNRCGTHVYTAYAYDSAGNRITPSATYANNRILTQGSLLFAHDADGNLTRKYTSSGTVNTVYAWDALSRLSGVTDSVAGRTVTFFYDADGQLVRRAINGVTNRYWLWQGGNIAFELDSVLNRRLAYSYLGTDWPIVALTQGNDILYPRRDAEGNLIWVQGTWGQRVDYDPWGGPSTDVTWMDWPLLWKGLLWQDRALVGREGLYFMRARWYDPEIGRFLSPDPIGVAGGMNPYVFAGNDPVNGLDPSGLTTYINCRGASNPNSPVGHCALHILNAQLRINMMIEMIPREVGDELLKFMHFRVGEDLQEQLKSYTDRWVPLSVPANMTTNEFDNAIVLNARFETYKEERQVYSRWGHENSNRFVYEIVRRSGSQVSREVPDRFPLGAPGLCGGKFRTGTDCHDPNARTYFRPSNFGPKY